MEAQFCQGAVRISDYKALLQSELFLDMEKFSNNFVARNAQVLAGYGRKWVADPLHQWSRQWEYPFVFSEIEKYATAHSGRPIKVFDAGSGMTFFPYFIEESVREASLTCCDTDGTLEGLYRAVNAQTGQRVEFLHKDIKKTGLESSSLDIVYCISVLEHTSNYDGIIKEFVRILRDDGILIVTFDISLDGYSDIPVSEVKKLVTSLQNHFSPTDKSSIIRVLDEKELFSQEVITTVFISDWNKSLLPWKYPLVSSLLTSFRKRTFPHFGVKNLTFTCHTFSVL